MSSNSLDLNKRKKLEELRKRLQSMPVEEFKLLLDNSSDKNQWQIDVSNKAVDRMNYLYSSDPQEADKRALNARKGITKESRTNQGKEMKKWHQNAIEHKERIRSNILGDKNPSKSKKVIEKRNNTFRTSGRLFIELNSNSYGYVSDMKDEFKLSKSQILYLSTKKKIPVRGKALGLLIKVYDENIHPHISQLKDIRKIKK